jgi:hypothetical protein
MATGDLLKLLLHTGGKMETVDWMSVAAAGLAIAIFAGGLLMMFTNIWTTRDR